MTWVELLLAIADGEHGADRLDAASDESEDVERRLVGPVDVFDHDDGRPTAKLVDQRGRDRVGNWVAAQELEECATRRRGDVVQRTERLRRAQPVAHPS